MTGLQHSPHTLEKVRISEFMLLTLKSFETVFLFFFLRFKNSQRIQPFCSEGSAVA